MSGQKLIVRVDFYPTGEMLPLSITSACGNSQFIDKILKIEKNVTKDKIKYFCLSNSAVIVLVYDAGEWYTEKL